MVASREGYALGVAHLEADQEGHGLNRIVASVHVVAEEQVVSEGNVASNGEQLDEVVKLPVDIAADGDGCAYRLRIGLIGEYLHGLVGDKLHLALGDRLELFEGLDDGVDIVVLAAHSNNMLDIIIPEAGRYLLNNHKQSKSFENTVGLVEVHIGVSYAPVQISSFYLFGLCRSHGLRTEVL